MTLRIGLKAKEVQAKVSHKNTQQAMSVMIKS